MRLGAIGEIRQDQRWRERLSGDDLDVIARIAGDTSRRFGYNWP